jgi:hypothetical protein
MKKTAQEIHNDQLKDLSKGLKGVSITEAKEVAKLKEQTLIDEQPIEPSRPLWHYWLGMAIIIGLALIALMSGCSTLKKPEKPENINACGYVLNTGLKVYEQHCDPSNRRNVGEPVCIDGNVIIDDCNATDKQYIIKEVLR